MKSHISSFTVNPGEAVSSGWFPKASRGGVLVARGAQSGSLIGAGSPGHLKLRASPSIAQRPDGGPYFGPPIGYSVVSNGAAAWGDTLELNVSDTFFFDYGGSPAHLAAVEVTAVGTSEPVEVWVSLAGELGD